jgi:hypothetical protein
MEKGLAPAERDDAGAKVRQKIDAPKHLIDRDGFGEVIELVAVGTSEIATADGHDMSKNRMVGGRNAAGEHAPFANSARHASHASLQSGSECRHIR